MRLQLFVFFLRVPCLMNGSTWFVSKLAMRSVNFQDLAPQHVSVLIAVSNTFATLPGIVVPIVTGWIVQNKEASEWQTVFYITASVYAVGALTYGLFASGERQPWAVASSDDRPVDEENETGALHRLTKK